MTTIQPTIGEAPSGYAAFDSYFAQRSLQGERVHYAITLPLTQVPLVLPIPNPLEPFEDNRQVHEGHAKDFASYIRNHKGWHAGSLTVRAVSSAVRFKMYEGGDMGPVKIGMLEVPRNSNNAFRIIDGQHRVLGVSILLRQLGDELVEARSRRAKAERIRAEKAAIELFDKEIAALEALKTRVENDSITIDLLIEDDTDLARQIFVDVANNARGVAKSVTALFDQNKVVNRAVSTLLEDGATSALIRNRVDTQNDRVTGRNPNIIGAGNLSEVVRAVQVGINGRISAAQEKTLDHKHVAQDANTFFNVLTESFPEFADIASGEETVGDMRQKSIMVSVTMIRVLAGVYYNLANVDHIPRAEIISYFQKIAKHTDAPVRAGTKSGDLWINATVDKAFADGASAPGSRSQAVKQLVDAMTGWYSTPPTAFN